MATRIGLMGFGRIGRNLLRIVERDPRFELAVVSDIAEHEALAYLLRYDTILGRYPGEVSLASGRLKTPHLELPLVAGRDPGDVDWAQYRVDYVVEATSKRRTRAELARHLERGAKRVLLCAPPAEHADLSVVYGINHRELAAEHRLISNASCTAHCAAPILAALDDAFGIERAWLSVVHAYSSVGRLADVPAEELRLSRAAAENIVPAETNLVRVLDEVLPRLKGRVNAAALRVPVQNGSLCDITVWLNRATDKSQLNRAIAAGAAGPFCGLIEFNLDPIVSSDVAQSIYSSVFDAQSTMMIGERCAKLIAWFDNSWGYVHRAVDLLAYMAELDRSAA